MTNKREGVCPDCGQNLVANKTRCSCGWSELDGTGGQVWCHFPKCPMPGTQKSFDGNWRCGFHDRNPHAPPNSVLELKYDGRQRSKTELLMEQEMLKFERHDGETRTEYLDRLKEARAGFGKVVQPMPRGETMQEKERKLLIAKAVRELAEQQGHDGREPGADDDL